MRSYRLPAISWFLLLTTTCIIFSLPACKKSSDKRHHAESEGKFNFTYKGQQYTLPYNPGAPDWGFQGTVFIINRPDIFNGRFHFPYKNCAYLEPLSSNLNVGQNCELTDFGLPIDSTAVFIYKSGSLDFSYSNCETRTVYDPPLGNITINICDLNGTLNITLKNKEGNTVEITNGVFQQYNFKW